MRVRDVDFAADVVEGPQVRDGRSAVHHDDQAPLSAKVGDQELEEGVEGEGFVDVAEGVDPEGDAEGGERGPGGGAEDGDHDQDADDMALEEGFAVVLGLEEGSEDGEEASEQGREAGEDEDPLFEPGAGAAGFILFARVGQVAEERGGR